MLYACVQKFNVTGNLQIFWELTKALHLICPRSNIPRLFWTHFKHMTEFRRISQVSYIGRVWLASEIFFTKRQMYAGSTKRSLFAKNFHGWI